MHAMVSQIGGVWESVATSSGIFKLMHCFVLRCIGACRLFLDSFKLRRGSEIAT